VGTSGASGVSVRSMLFEKIEYCSFIDSRCRPFGHGGNQCRIHHSLRPRVVGPLLSNLCWRDPTAALVRAGRHPATSGLPTAEILHVVKRCSHRDGKVAPRV